MQIRVTFDRAAYNQQVSTYLAEHFAPALQTAANLIGAYARQRLMEASKVYLDNPVSWTVNAFASRPLLDGTTGVRIYVMPLQAQYLQYMVFGGPRHAGDYATTPGGPLLPGRDATVDVHGNLSPTFVRDAIADGAVWAKLKPGGPPTLILPGRGKLQILAVVVPEVTYKAKFPFYDIVQKAVFEATPKALARTLR